MVLLLLVKLIIVIKKGKYIGVNTIENIKQLGDDDLDLDELKELVNNKKNENLYTEDSYKKYADIYADASKNF